MAEEKNHRNLKQDIQIVRLEEQLKASNAAKETAYRELERRLEGMNEFRAQLNSQAQSFVTKAELCAVEERLNGELKLLRNTTDWIIRIFILGILVAIAMKLFV